MWIWMAACRTTSHVPIAVLPPRWRLRSGSRFESERLHADRHGLCGAQPVAQRKDEGIRFDFEDVACLRLHPGAEGKRGGAEEMDMDIARAAEAGIFEMMRLQVGDGVAHIVFAGKEGLVEDALIAAAD